jgi:hypothetical protein
MRREGEERMRQAQQQAQESARSAEAAEASRQRRGAKAPKSAFTVVEAFNAEGRCGDAVYYARDFNDPALLSFALSCRPK